MNQMRKKWIEGTNVCLALSGFLSGYLMSWKEVQESWLSKQGDTKNKLSVRILHTQTTFFFLSFCSQKTHSYLYTLSGCFCSHPIAAQAPSAPTRSDSTCFSPRAAVGVHETRARESQNGKGGAKGGTRKGKEEARETRRVLFSSQLGSWKFSQSRRHVDRRKHETGPFVTKVGVVITGREERNEGAGEKEGKGRQMISNTSPKTKHIVKAPTIVCVCPFLVKRKIVEHCKNTEVRFHKLNIYNSQEDTSIISFKNLKIPSSTTNKAFNSVDY